MKIPKNINKNADVELTTYPGFQEKPFVITGPYVTVEPYALATPEPRKQRAVRAKRVVAPVVKKLATDLRTKLRIDLRTRLYDMQHGTKFYDTLRRKRADERDFTFASKIGLYIEPECAKHRKSLEVVRGLAASS